MALQVLRSQRHACRLRDCRDPQLQISGIGLCTTGAIFIKPSFQLLRKRKTTWVATFRLSDGQTVTSVQLVAASILESTSIRDIMRIPLEVTSLPFWMITNRCQ